jgi:hypothetical protein
MRTSQQALRDRLVELELLYPNKFGNLLQEVQELASKSAYIVYLNDMETVLSFHDETLGEADKPTPFAYQAAMDRLSKFGTKAIRTTVETKTEVTLDVTSRLLVDIRHKLAEMSPEELDQLLDIIDAEAIALPEESLAGAPDA